MLILSSLDYSDRAQTLILHNLLQQNHRTESPDSALQHQLETPSWEPQLS